MFLHMNAVHCLKPKCIKLVLCLDCLSTQMCVSIYLPLDALLYFVQMNELVMPHCVCTRVIYMRWVLCSPSGARHEETPLHCHSELPWQQVIWLLIWITWSKMDELPVWHAHVCACNMQYVFVTLYCIFISVYYVSVHTVCVCVRICILYMTISESVRECVFPEWSHEGEDLTLQGLGLPPPLHLTHHQRSWEKGSAGSICKRVRVCVCAMWMMDWGHGRLQGCDVAAKTNSCTCVWGRCFIATQHIEISQINTPLPLLCIFGRVCVCARIPVLDVSFWSI